jgi:hypothetical protein
MNRPHAIKLPRSILRMTNELKLTAAPSGASVIAFHDDCLQTVDWPKRVALIDQGDVWYWVQRNHEQNSLLWEEEDLARRTMATDADLTANKRAIDRFNQARNDATERVDEFLLLALGLIDPVSVGTDQPKSTVASGARLNSETAASIMDRMSIMSLKIKAMRAQTTRTDAEQSHRDSSTQKLVRLQEQRNDLAACLDQLFADCKAQRAYFKVYRQFKMYNDARFNPVLVAEQKRALEQQAQQ